VPYAHRKMSLARDLRAAVLRCGCRAICTRSQGVAYYGGFNVQVWTALNADYIEKQAAKQAATDAAQEVCCPTVITPAAHSTSFAWFAGLTRRVTRT
jgi:hypothetical protein